MQKITVSDVTESFPTMRRIEYKRLCFETRLLLVKRKGLMGETRFTLLDAAVPCVCGLKDVRRRRRTQER